MEVKDVISNKEKKKEEKLLIWRKLHFFVWSLLLTSQNKASVFVQSRGILLFLASEKILLKSGRKLQLE